MVPLGQLWVNSTKGTLLGTVKLIYGDANLEPELAHVTLAVSETTPAVPLASFDAGMVTSSDRVLSMYKCKDDANCHFTLPHIAGATGSTTQRAMPAEHAAQTTNEIEGEIEGNVGGEIEAADEIEGEIAALSAFSSASSLVNPFATDACNAYTSCNTCIGATTPGGLVCGWCTTPVHYTNSSAPKYQCAGSRTGAASGWTCFGVYRTLSCYDYTCDPVSRTCKPAPGQAGLPTRAACEKSCTAPSPWQRCSFSGPHRGLQIDLNYARGEWDANFDVLTNFTTATFTFIPTGYSFSGQVVCRSKSQAAAGDHGDFKLSLTNGTELYGLYQAGGAQP